MTKEQLKELVLQAIEENKEEFISIGKEIFQNPELGFKEENTAKIVKDTFSKLNIPFESEIALTGVMGSLKGKNANVNVAVMGELDAVVCPLHPFANKQSGGAHSCGHFAQITHLLAVATAFAKTGVMDYLNGDITFIAVPAEEFVELEFREKLQAEGKIEFFGGKQEFVRLGKMDHIDMCMMAHASNLPGRTIELKQNTAGFIGKLIQFDGKEAHAGAAPHLGVNALNAATLGLMAIHAQRETFEDKDSIRVHPIITKGGDLVNIVPADVRMETYVRGNNIDSVVKASKKVNRALEGAAYSVGAQVTIKEIPGYLPLIQSEELTDVFRPNVEALVGKENVIDGEPIAGSSDTGDIGALMPMVQLSTSGFEGGFHSKDFSMVDEEMSLIIPAKAMAMTLIDLLYDGASVAKKIKDNYQPQFKNGKEYMAFWQEILNNK